MRWKYLVAGLALAGFVAHADDMETMFDDAQAKTKKTASATDKTVSPLFYILQSEIKNPNGEQSLFIRYIEAGEWDKALLQYKVAFEGTPFAKSANGRALYALAHYRSGLEVTGLELLFSTVEKPGDAHPEIRAMWKTAAPATHLVWDLAQIKWRPAFAEMFSAEAAFRAEVRQLATMKDTAALTALYTKLPSNSMERARVGWQLTIAYALKDDVENSAKTLAQLMKTEPMPVSRDLMQLTAARLLYHRAHYSAAIKYYEKVGKQSEYWPDAQEEIAWSYIRKGESNNALAISKSLILPAMTVQAGAEGYFVHALAELKMCDYPAVVMSLENFPKVFKPRVEMLEKVASTSESPEAKRLISRLMNGRITRMDLGKDAKALPRMVARDDRLFDFAQAQKLQESEAAAAERVFAASLSQTGLQGYFDKVRQDAKLRAHVAAAAANTRIQELARQEAKEIREILKKLHIVEAEVIQQVSVAERIASNTKGPAKVQKGVTGSKERDVLKFKAEKEVWFDEIGNYRVNVKKSCQAAGRGKST